MYIRSIVSTAVYSTASKRIDFEQGQTDKV